MRRKLRSEFTVDDLETSKQFQINYSRLMGHILETRPYISEVHGPKHWQQVEYNGLLLADKTGADVERAIYNSDTNEEYGCNIAYIMSDVK